MDYKLTKNLILTGMMGVGKSTIGKKLAKRLSFGFSDVDTIIEMVEKTTIRNLFNTKGESYFRKIEAKITLKELDKKKVVISLGGGAITNDAIRSAIRKKECISFWLDTDINILDTRLKKSKIRPLLFKKNLKSALIKIYTQRKKFYNKADFRVKCDLLKPDEIIDKILKYYESSRN